MEAFYIAWPLVSWRAVGEVVGLSQISLAQLLFLPGRFEVLFIETYYHVFPRCECPGWRYLHT